MSDRCPRKKHPFRKSFSQLLFEELTGIKTLSPFDRQQKRKERENKKDEKRFGKAMDNLEKEHRKLWKN